MIEKSNFFAILDAVFAENGLAKVLTETTREKFYDLTDIMLTAGEHMNITAIKDVREIILRHYADSLMLLSAGIDKKSVVIDVGCGGGFPCLPLAVVRKDLKITGIDSTGKKVDYVNETARRLNLDNLRAYPARAEEICLPQPRKEKGMCGTIFSLRETADVVTARAVAALPVLSELCLPFASVGGKFIAMKSKNADEELIASLSAIEKLGGRIEDVKEITLKGSDTDGDMGRTLIIISKISPTPEKYPRQYSQIKKKPL